VKLELEKTVEALSQIEKQCLKAMKEGKEYTREEVKKLMTRQQRVGTAMNEIASFHKKVKQGK